MPTFTAPIAGLTLPVPQGALDSDLDDPTVSGMLDWLAFWVKDALDDKLGNLRGMASDACPIANRFKYNPAGYFVRNPFPALYVWPEGRSLFTGRTIAYYQRQRTLMAMYFFEEIVAPGGASARHGLIAAVDAAWQKSRDRGRHPNSGYNGDAPGTALYRSLNLVGWDYEFSEPGFMAPIPNVPAQGGGAGAGYVTRGYPCLKATLTVYEQIEPNQLGQSDLIPDVAMTLETGDSINNTVSVLDRVLEPSDGSDPSES